MILLLRNRHQFGLRRIPVFLGICLICGLAPASEDTELEKLLQQMESVGRKFQSYSAQFTQKKYTAILKEFDTPESGDFFYARAKDGSALMRQEVTKPGRRIVTIKGSVVTNYQPNIKQAQIINLGKNKDKAEYLAIGLGQSPGKLRLTFDMKYLGAESIDGAPCSVLQLKPKSVTAAAYFSTITLWIEKATGVPVQQKLQEPSGDFLLVKFAGAKLNSRIPDSKFEQNLPDGVEIQRLQ